MGQRKFQTLPIFNCLVADGLLLWFTECVSCGFWVFGKMSRVADSSAFNGDFSTAVNHLLNFPETIYKFMLPSRAYETNNENKGAASIPLDILDSPKEYIFFLDLPGLSKSDIQVISHFPTCPNLTYFSTSSPAILSLSENELCEWLVFYFCT